MNRSDARRAWHQITCRFSFPSPLRRDIRATTTPLNSCKKLESASPSYRRHQRSKLSVSTTVLFFTKGNTVSLFWHIFNRSKNVRPASTRTAPVVELLLFFYFANISQSLKRSSTSKLTIFDCTTAFVMVSS